MASQDTSREQQLSLLNHRPYYFADYQIVIPEPAKLLSNWQTSHSSSSGLGNLDHLPLELLHTILTLLDFRTLSHITRTCHRGIEVVKSLLEYRDLMLHAPEALAALGKTRLIRHHIAATVHKALRAADCTSCGRYGAFLFLPSCERCCYNCLWSNQSLWLLPRPIAKECFGLSAAGTKTLPFMRSVPGTYSIRHTIHHPKPVGLVCVGDAKKLAIAENKSEESMRQHLENKRSAGLSQRKYQMYHYLQSAPIARPEQELWLQPTVLNPRDQYGGMGSLPFPHLAPDKHVERGFWCRGCELVYNRWVRSPRDPAPDHLSHLILPGGIAANVVFHFHAIARSKAEFLAHIDECPGAKELLRTAGAV